MAVIGGGITGALVAHELVRAGLDTVVVDKRHVGWGSTAASTALLQYEIDTTLCELARLHGMDHAARAYLACRGAIDQLTALAHILPDDVGFERKKSLYLAASVSDRRLLHDEWVMRRAIGLQVDWLEKRDLAERFTLRRPAALLTHEAGQVDGYAFTHALLRNGIAAGLRVFARTEISDIRIRGSDLYLRTARDSVVRARYLVFAAGYEAEEFLPHPVARLRSTYAIASEPRAPVEGWGEGQCLIWEHRRPYLYLRTTPTGRVIVGGLDDSFRDPGRRDRAIPGKAKELLKKFTELFPDAELDVSFAWAGTFGESEDGLPFIDRHARWPNAYFALCYGGNGITFAQLAAEIIRDAVLGRPNAQADLFRFGR